MASRKTHSEQWWEDNPHILRCTAHYKSNGMQCRHEAAPGTNVCNQHGALIPAVQAKAAARIQMSVDDAVKRLHAMLDDGNVDARDKIKILHDLLDRGGLGATSKVLVGVGQIDPVEQLFASILNTPGMLTEAPAQHQLEPEYAEFNREALDGEDFPVVRGELAAPRQADPHDTPPKAARPVEAAESGSDRPPKHIRDDLIALGLL